MFKKTLTAIKEFIRLETTSGILLFVFAVIALILANSRFASFYQSLHDIPLSFSLGIFHIDKTLSSWVNDGLMTIFFLVVGLEIKRELLLGELNSLKKLALPGFAALGGMLLPAAIYVIINFNNAVGLKGWAIPTATDIAFALGVLSLLGKRVPISLKIFLTALAILDDLGAIIIIAIFYTKQFSLPALALALGCCLILWLFNYFKIKRLLPYLLLGLVLWLAIFNSGIHPTIAGVIFAAMIPIDGKGNLKKSPLYKLEHILHPWVALVILPIFAFFNAGTSLTDIPLHSYLNSIPLGIMLALFLGKQWGVMLFSWLAVKFGFASLPTATKWRDLYGIALLCGIGFTMSLFIGDLAYGDSSAKIMQLVHVGVLAGSLVSGLAGCLWLIKSRVN